MTLANLLDKPFTNPFISFYDRVLSAFEDSYNKNIDSRELKLPENFKAEINNKTYSIYPIEIAYSYDAPKNFRAMLCFQAYSAYTSWLDELNAEFFTNTDTAPELLIFNMDAIDGRLPLIECPAEWFAIYSNYKIKLCDYENNIFLLERIKSKTKGLKEFDTREIKINEPIEIPDNVCVMRVNFKLNTYGKIIKTLYSIPAVNMKINYHDGTEIQGRIIPDTLTNDLIISNILTTLKDFELFMSGDKNIRRVKSIEFSGAGLKYYEPDLKIVFSEIL